MIELSAFGKVHVDFLQLTKALPDFLGETVKKYLDLLTRDKPYLIMQKRIAGGVESNQYLFQYENAKAFLKGKMFESIVASKFGPLGCSIYRLLMTKHFLTDMQIADLLVGEVEEVRKTLALMHGESFVAMQELPQSAFDRSARHAAFLWTIHVNELNSILVRETARAIVNTNDRLKMHCERVEPLVAKYNEGQQLNQTLLNDEEMDEFCAFTKQQQLSPPPGLTRSLSQCLYGLVDMFYVLKDM